MIFGCDQLTQPRSKGAAYIFHIHDRQRLLVVPSPAHSGLPIDARLAHSCLDGHQISRKHLRQFGSAFGGARGRGSEGS
jgi:hypothetical protein